MQGWLDDGGRRSTGTNLLALPVQGICTFDPMDFYGNLAHMAAVMMGD